MNSLEDIAIQVVDGHEPEPGQVTANVMAILHEITHLLQELLEEKYVGKTEIYSERHKCCFIYTRNQGP